MKYDELAAKVSDYDQALADAHAEAQRLRELIAWYDALDPAAAVDTATAHAERITAERAEVRESLSNAKTEVTKLRIMSLVAYHPFLIGSDTFRNSPKRLREMKGVVAGLTERHDELEAAHEPAQIALRERQSEADEHAAFDRADATARLADLGALIASLTPGHERRTAQLAAIDEKIAPLLAALNKLERDIRQAPDPQSNYVRRLRGDQERIERKIAREKVKGTLDARKVVIDGSNFRFDDKNRDIKLSALRPLCERLVEARDVLVVFDANILTKVGLPDMDALQAELPEGVKLHRAPSKTEADELILRRARDETTCVLSNDRYPEYLNEPAVQDGRVLRVSIMSDENLIVVPDLDVEVPYAWTM